MVAGSPGCAVFSPESLTVKTTFVGVDPPANVLTSVFSPWLIRAKMSGPESSGWSHPSQAPNDCAWIPNVPLQAAGSGFVLQSAAPIVPSSSSQVISNWSMPLVSVTVGSPQ